MVNLFLKNFLMWTWIKPNYLIFVFGVILEKLFVASIQRNLTNNWELLFYRYGEESKEYKLVVQLAIWELQNRLMHFPFRILKSVGFAHRKEVSEQHIMHVPIVIEQSNVDDVKAQQLVNRYWNTSWGENWGTTQKTQRKRRFIYQMTHCLS